MRLRSASGDIIYDIDVVTDEFGRRMTPASGARRLHVLFFGCSFTWGDAVQGHETLPAAFAAAATEYRPYNYAFRGYGPQQTVQQLRNPDIRAQVPERDGIAVYTAIDEHIRRAIGSLRIVEGARRTFPYFRLDRDGRLVRDGSFVSGRPWRQLFYEVLSSSRVLRYFDLDVPAAISDGHFALTAALVADARDSYRARFGSDRFYVILYPGSRLLSGLRPHLDRHQIRYFDYANLFAAETRPTIIEGDGHPTPLAYRLVAARLAEDLRTRPELVSSGDVR
jgi:hypothetical protein